ncbi:hypothetical protein Godav_018325 [Gossypium davidsonii]|uniref:Uncharacterized protein n=1 Tax=Gossypium davidsonii TaxID=34287 RepID=A0A7J8QW21_GOSDV|nr:hypothetical protein [Gossypium davidsonii]
MDTSEYEALCQWLKGWDFLSPSCDGTLQKRGDTFGPIQTHHGEERKEVKKEVTVKRKNEIRQKMKR